MDKIKLEVIQSGNSKIEMVKKGNLHAILAELGYQIAAPCGGEGRCGKCKVIYNGKEVLACKTEVEFDSTVEINQAKGSGLLKGIETVKSGVISQESGASIALDIGTTTLAFYFLDNETSRELWRYSCLNPQCSFGADVVSRISASDNYLDMFEVMKNCINDVIAKFFENNASTKKISKLVACGNTTMSHLFAKENPSSMGVSPFTPIFLETRYFKGEELGVNVDNITLVPSISAFVGGDITCGVLVTEMEKGTNLLIDIGTNGEIVASKNGKLYGTATAAGPAFEGGNISCGVGGIDGAISSVKIENGEVKYTTIGEKTPIGICGSGLFECISELLKAEILDETGYMDEDFEVAKGVLVTKKDIREFQVGKSAVASGVKVLLDNAGISEDEIENVFLAGGLGFYLSPVAIAEVGLLSETLANKINVVGNSAGSGAIACLTNEKNIAKAEDICGKTKIIDLGGSEQFNNEFAMNMMLEKMW